MKIFPFDTITGVIWSNGSRRLILSSHSYEDNLFLVGLAFKQYRL